MIDLRGYIGKPSAIEGPSPDYQIAKALLKNPQKTLYFSGVRGSKFDVVGNVITDRESVYRSIGTDKENHFKDISKYFNNPIEPSIVGRGDCQERECLLNDLPVLRHFEKDGGRYITSGVVIAKDPEYGVNASIHRLMIHEDNLIGIRIVPRHLFEYFKRAEKRDEDLEVAVVIGLHPALFYAASYSPPLGYSELSFAGGILGQPLEVVRCKTVDVPVPSQAEIIIEGKILCGERMAEGPFADVTGTYDRIRDEPLIKVSKVTHRKGAIYQALLPSSIEHRLFMGMPREPEIYRKVSEVSKVGKVCLTDGGKNWLQGVISLKKGERDIKRVIERAFAGHPSMKHVVVVDEDIDVFSPDEVEYAISTRFQAHKDAYVFKKMRGSTLDPSTDVDGKTTKVGIDATIPLGREPDYEFAKIP
jgi:4-hydroxy-3-polyprenylbenzoate decarboxylase